MSSKVGFLPGELGKFVLRSQVLSLYRSFFRTSRSLPPQQKGEQQSVQQAILAVAEPQTASLSQ
jgi:hypothetical protein